MKSKTQKLGAALLLSGILSLTACKKETVETVDTDLNGDTTTIVTTKTTTEGLDVNTEKAEADLKEHARQQNLHLEDLNHQLKSPIIQCYARVASILKDELIGERLRSELYAIRGLCGKGRRVTMSIGLFAALARGESILAKPSPLQNDDLIKMLIAAASDNEILVDPSREIRFSVERDTFDVLRSVNVQADQELLEQAVNNIFDNAAKYL